MRKLLFIAQFPPPYGGQTIMQEQIYNFLKKEYHDNVKHVSMNFSNSMAEVGGVSIGKLKVLLKIVFQMIFYRLRGYSVLYYPPSGPNRVPIIRDVIILSVAQILFKDIIFHFHASGLSEFFNKSTFYTPIAKFAFRANNAIILSERNAPDDKFVQAENVSVIPYGIDDPTKSIESKKGNSKIRLLYVGVLKESKGLFILLNAINKIKEKNFSLDLVGEFDSPDFKKKCLRYIKEHSLQTKVKFHGVKTGNEKWKLYALADIFIFPTFFESESFGLVLIEAMSFGLPIITTDWRGVPSVVDENCSIVVQPKDVNQLADAIFKLMDDDELRKNMKLGSRKKFKKSYTKNIFENKIHSYFENILK